MTRWALVVHNAGSVQRCRCCRSGMTVAGHSKSVAPSFGSDNASTAALTTPGPCGGAGFFHFHFTNSGCAMWRIVLPRWQKTAPISRSHSTRDIRRAGSWRVRWSRRTLSAPHPLTFSFSHPHTELLSHVVTAPVTRLSSPRHHAFRGCKRPAHIERTFPRQREHFPRQMTPSLLGENVRNNVLPGRSGTRSGRCQLLPAETLIATRFRDSPARVRVC